MAVVNELDRLFESDSNQEPDHDRSDMDEEAFPCVNRLVGSVNIEHRR
jgi:hypothetical protein